MYEIKICACKIPNQSENILMFITLKTPRNTILIEPCSQNMFDCSSLMIVDDRIFEIKKKTIN